MLHLILAVAISGGSTNLAAAPVEPSAEPEAAPVLQVADAEPYVVVGAIHGEQVRGLQTASAQRSERALAMTIAVVAAAGVLGALLVLLLLGYVLPIAPLRLGQLPRQAATRKSSVRSTSPQQVIVEA